MLDVCQLLLAQCPGCRSGGELHETEAEMAALLALEKISDKFGEEGDTFFQGRLVRIGVTNLFF